MPEVVAPARLQGANAILRLGTNAARISVFVAVRLRPRRPILVATLWTLAFALPMVLLGLRAPLWAVIAGSFLCGAAFDVFGVLWETTMQRTIPAAALSRVSSYDWLGSLLLGPLGLLAAGPAGVARLPDEDPEPGGDPGPGGDPKPGAVTADVAA